jgi:WD40 repeat protein/tRNA A-37 threonylcarbamoyl transferase component Bud32
LLAFHLGTLAEGEVDAVADHLETCSACEAAVNRLDTAVDPMLSALRRAPAVTPSGARGPASTQQARIQGPRDPFEPEANLEANWPALPGLEILAPLGHGGMGVVYKARQLRLNRLVALKRLRSSDPREAARSRIEAEALARLQHPNIVQIFEVIEHEGRVFLALELVEGGPLGRVLTGKPQPFRETAALLETLARAVHYAHVQGIVHRDLKPANILLQSANGKVHHEKQSNGILHFAVPKIADFGLAKRLSVESGETREGDVIGTPAYMAPEQAGGKGDTIGPATDVYSLGVILYEMLTGRVPLQGPSTLDTLVLVRTEEPVPPRRLQPRIPRDLETICLKCLEKEPHKRYPSAQELARDLRRALDGEPIRARPTPAWERFGKWVKRRPVVAALIGAVVLVAALGFGLVAWQWQRAEDKALAEAAARQDAQDKEKKEKEARRQLERLSAAMTLSQSATLCEKGDLGRGLLGMARALEMAHNADDAALERAIRVNLSAWQALLLQPRALCPHKNWVWDVAFSADSRVFMTGSADSTARLWDTATGQPRTRPLRHPGPVWAVAVSPNGKVLLTGCSALNSLGEARLWDARTGKPLKRQPSPQRGGGVTAVAFHPNGQTYLTVCPEQACLWRTADSRPVGQPIRPPRPLVSLPFIQPKLTALFSPDGKLVATGGENGRTQLWDATTGKRVGEPLVTSGPVLALAFSPDSRTLATGSFMGGAQMWDVATGEKRGPVLQHQGRVKTVAFSSDGTLLATGGAVEEEDAETLTRRIAGGEVRLWRAATGRPISVLPHPSPVWSLAFSPGARILVTGCEDAHARFFLTATAKPMGAPLAHEGLVQAVAISPDGTAALTGSAGGDSYAAARLWQLPPEQNLGKALMHGGAPLVTLHFSRNAKILASGAADGTAQLFRLPSGRRLGTALGQGGTEVHVDVSPDGRTVLTASEGVALWDAESGRRHFSLGGPDEKWPTGGWSSGLAFDRSGRTFLAGWRNGLVQFYRTATGKPVGRPVRAKRIPVWSVHLSPDGQRILLGIDSGAQLWSRKTGRLVAECTTQAGHYTANYYPNGKKALVFNETNAQIWDLERNRLAAAPRFHPEKGIWNVAFTPDGRSVLISSNDGFTRLWDVATGKHLGPPLHNAGHGPVAVDSRGRMLAAGGRDGRITVWPVPRPVDGTVERVKLWVEVITGMERQTEESTRTLTEPEIEKRRRRLQDLGGPLYPWKGKGS